MTPNTSAAKPLTELAGSEWDENLLARFQEHVEGEAELLEAYAAFREEGPEYVRYLVDLVLADEARHHQTFSELVNRIRADIDWRDYGPRVPYVDLVRHEAASSLVGATNRLIEFERDEELDTKKHIAILEFIRRKATERL